jgi:hypothetical protein
MTLTREKSLILVSRKYSFRLRIDGRLTPRNMSLVIIQTIASISFINRVENRLVTEAET